LSDGHKLEKPYGVERRLHYLVHAGRASPESGFALQSAFEWEGREFGLTTELDVIALDRTKVVRPSAFRGVELEPGEQLPVGFVKGHAASRYELDPLGNLVATGNLGQRQGVKLTGERKTGGFVEARDGSFVVEAALRAIGARSSFPSFATGNRKWVDISIDAQTLVAYEGRRAVYATLVSTGRGGMGDPEEVPATIRGTFMIHYKAVSSTMDGDEDKSDSFDLRDVPFVQYFHKGYALHGTYWHDDFGEIRSHGCVNLSPLDAAWLFEWTDPPVPDSWHAVINKERGTVVYIHY
jgi:lipoprotein-anchoring transpeptidase ErfK/SrfK